MSGLLHVWRDLYTRYELVGELSRDASGVRFRYDDAYEGQAISVALPVDQHEFSARQTGAFFSALSPEGETRANLAKLMRMGDSEYEPLLERLNDETIGALAFTTPGNVPGQSAGYQPVDDDLLDALATSPTETAVRTMSDARLSLSGAMAKVGLYQDGRTGEWHLPTGAAPSNRIVKAGSDLFPHETLNEALCLDVARRCGLPAASATLVGTARKGPLLAVSRYDRPVPNDARLIDGLPVPRRLHQEDLCQACSLDTLWKYEPTDGRYLHRIVGTASRHCDNGFGEAHLLLEYVLFDYLIGNCDNHLKNFSLLYGRNWLSREVAPLYDVVSTSLYPSLATDMGVSLSPGRSIFGLTRIGLETAIADAGLPVKLGMGAFADLAESIVGAIEESRDHFSSLGYGEARLVAELLIDGARKRAAFDYSPANAKTL